MATPFSTQFNWRDIGVLGPYGLLIRCKPQTPNFFDAGDINNRTNNLGMNYTLFINAGRTGSPGLEVNITMMATNTQPQMSVTICLEPGVQAGREGDDNHYNLHIANTQFLGLSGGGGHMYDHDPQPVHAGVPNTLRKETLRIKLTSHGHVCHDPDGLAAIRARLPGGSTDARLLDAMTSSRGTNETVYYAWFYCRVPAATHQAFTNTVLVWLKWMCDQHCLPLFQYTTRILNMNMDSIAIFWNSMYSDIVLQQGIPVLGPPILQIADTIGSKSRQTRAFGNSIALIREHQAHEEFCVDLGQRWQEMKLLWTGPPVLRKATRLLPVRINLPTLDLPTDMAVYLGYVFIRSTSRTFPISTPFPGSLFLVIICKNVQGTMQRTSEIAYGMVIEPDHAITAAGAHFAIGLWIRDPNLRNMAQINVRLAPKFPIEVRFIQNRQVPLTLLSRMVRFTNFSTTSSVQALQTNVFRQTGPSSFHDDIHQGPRAPFDDPAEMTRLDGIFEGFAKTVCRSPFMADVRDIERRLLFNIPGRIFGKTQLIRTTIGAESFRAVYGLIMILVGMGHRVIFVVDQSTDRSRVCWDLLNLFQNTGNKDESEHRTWRSKRLLSYTSTDVECNPPSPEESSTAARDLSHSGNSLRPALELYFKMLLDDLPSHEYLHDQGALYSASAASAPTYHTPQAMSWADYLQNHFILHPGDRAQHFRNRARVLNGQVITPEESTSLLGHLSQTRRMILSRADVLVCNSATAMSSDVRAAFPDSLIFIGNAHRMSFANGASILLQRSGHIASFLLGNMEDRRHGPVMFASEGRNEAMLTLRRSFWETYVWARKQLVDLE